MINRSDLCAILKNGAGEVEYGKGVKWVKKLPLGDVRIGFVDGEVGVWDLVIGMPPSPSR